MRGTDCHDQFANWSRNDIAFAKRCGAAVGRRYPALRTTSSACRRDDVGIVPCAEREVRRMNAERVCLHFVRRLGRFVFNLYTNSVFCLL